MSIDVDQFRADSSPTRWCPIGSFKVEVMYVDIAIFLSSPLAIKACWRMPPVSCYGSYRTLPVWPVWRISMHLHTHTHIHVYIYIYI